MGFGGSIGHALLALPVLLFSIVVHEFAHAYTAYLAGDDTAAAQGRLTLNPVSHIDPIGTLLIPILQFMMPARLPLIGWARPVPVNPLRFKSSEWDIFVSLAGPGSNFLLVVIAAVLMKVAVWTNLITSGESPLFVVLLLFITINCCLGIFNLIPVPPLDGSRVLHRFLASARSPLADRYAALEPYGFIILILILMSPLARVFGWIVTHAVNLVFELMF